MRLVIDGRVLAERRGVARMVRELLPRLAAQPDFDTAVLTIDASTVPQGARAVEMRRSARGRVGPFEHWIRLPHDLARTHPDVVWSPFLDPPRRSPAPWVQTVHDLIPLVYDDPIFRRDRRGWKRRLRGFRRASRLVADSRHTAELLVDRFGFPAATVEVVRLGIDPTFRPASSARTRPDPPTIAMVAGWGPHKGFAEAMEVVARVADAGHPHRLVIAGPADAWMAAQARRQRTESRRPERVELAGYVEDLLAHYWNADVVLVPSRYEGFGLPLLEAMACGRPVVAFANSSLVEVAGDGAELVADGDVAAMTKAVLALLDDPDRAGDLGRRGVQQAAMFRWEAAASAYAAIFSEVAHRG